MSSVAAGLAVLVLGGCGPRATRFEIIDHAADGSTATYFEEFGECYYRLEPVGRFDIVARRVARETGAADLKITQVVHLRGIWRAQPGRTYADETMINTTVSYMIIGAEGAASFEGAGFVYFAEDHDRDEARGRLELANLAPVRRVGEGRRIFERAEVEGKFRAQRDDRQVTRILSELRQLFGPMPRYEPPADGNDVL